MFNVRSSGPARIFCAVLAACVIAVAQSPLLSECRRAFYRGDYPRAEQLAAQYLRKNSSDVTMRVMLGRAELAQGKLLAAFEELRKALATAPQDPDTLYYLSFAARALSQQEYQKLLAMHPDSSQVHELLAEAAMAEENPTLAEAEFLKALKANPRSVEAATGLAELKRSQSKFDEAITYYMQAAQSAPLDYDVAYGLGACYTYKQEYAQAIDWLRKAVGFAPDSVAAHFALGNALFQSQQLDLAIPELRTSLRLEPRMRQAYFLLGRSYAKLGRKDEADAAFQKLEELDRSGAGTTEPVRP